jgi:hypothetical protein
MYHEMFCFEIELKENWLNDDNVTVKAFDVAWNEVAGMAVTLAEADIKRREHKPDLYLFELYRQMKIVDFVTSKYAVLFLAELKTQASIALTLHPTKSSRLVIYTLLPSTHFMFSTMRKVGANWITSSPKLNGLGQIIDTYGILPDTLLTKD